METKETTSQTIPLVILRRREVQARTGLGRSTIYDGIQAGTFPRPIQLGPRSVGWIESEVTAWLVARIAVRDEALLSSMKDGR